MIKTLKLYSDKILSQRNDKNTLTGSNNKLRGLYPNESSFFNGAIYKLNHFYFGQLTGEVGLRYNIYKASLFDETLGSIDLHPKALVFQGGLNYMLSNQFSAYTNVSEGFRSPNLDDLATLGIVDFRYEVPAYDLKPERSLNKEIGLKFRSNKIKGDISLFNTRLNNLITRVKTSEVNSGYAVYKKINVDRGYIRGWEMQIKYLVLKQLSVYGNATYLFGESTTRNEPLRRIPPFNARVTLDYSIDKIVTGLSFDYASAQKRLAAADKSDNRIPLGGTPDYKLVNLYGGFDGKKIILRAYLNNLFNIDYRTHGSGINGIGRSIGLSCSIRFFQS
jgi:hemoglobin/transferrin/lactoferrin receptor protein